MLFHAGCLLRLNELGVLGKLNGISSVSGGSITAALLGIKWDLFNPQPGVPCAAFSETVVSPLREMASTTVDTGAILGGIFLPGSIADHVSSKYAKILFDRRPFRTFQMRQGS